jgi:D-3-phosphoglycerate dehydrogenase
MLKGLPKILVASKTCRAVMSDADAGAVFLRRGLEGDFGFLEEKRESLGVYEGIIIGTEPIGKAELESMTRAKVIHKFGVGVDNIDLAAARDHGIAVMSMPGINSGAVAEMAFGLMLAAARRICEGDRCVRGGSWARIKGRSLAGKTLGIIGTGAIGRALCALVSGFNMKILGFDLIENKNFRSLGGRYTNLPGLLREADVISIHVPLSEATRGLLGREELKLVKNTAVIVNAARGGIVDEDALVEFLAQNSEASAAFDVLEDESGKNNPFKELDNAIVTPHIAAYDHDTLTRMFDAAVNNLSSFFGSSNYA